MAAVGGWPHVISFMGQTERTNVTSVVCLAFLDAANAHPRSAKFGLKVLGGISAFSFDKILTARERFPALRDIVVEVNGFGWNDGKQWIRVVPGLQLLLPQLASFTSITELDLRSQKLVSFPDSLCALTGLKKLNLTRGPWNMPWNWRENLQPVMLPDSIAALTALKTLTISNSKFTTLPKPIVKLTSLTKLDLDYTRLVTLPDSIAALTALQELDLYGNKFTTLPKPIAKLTSLTSLNLRSNGLVTLPDSIAALTALETLILANNQLVTLPDCITALTALKKLHLGCNQLVTLPEPFVKLTRLTKLWLGSNPLLTLPDATASMTALTDLNLHGNNFMHMYINMIVKLTGLTKLDLSQSGDPLTAYMLVTLPDSIAALTALEELSLYGNQLVTLPDSIAALAALKKLDLENNPSLAKPQSSAVEAWLTALRAGGCYIRDHPFGLVRGEPFDRRVLAEEEGW